MANPLVFWVGQDGNIWLKSPEGTFNQGKPSSVSNSGYQIQGENVAVPATRIEDPAVQGSSAPSGGGGGTPFNQVAADNTQRAIDLIPGLLSGALGSEDTNYGNVRRAFDSQEATQRGTYDKSSETNQLNFDSAYMDAIRAGIRGLSGLFALLRGTGASGGTADEQVRNLVGGTTANDIRGGADTRDTNQTALDASLASFLTDLKGKRQLADDTHANNIASIRRGSNTNLQDLYEKMAGYYSEAGNTSAANSWLNRAGELTNDIAANSNKQVSKYDTSPVVVHAPNLTAFQAPTEPSVVSSPNGQVGSGIFTIGSNRRKDQQSSTLRAAPAGA